MNNALLLTLKDKITILNACSNTYPMLSFMRHPMRHLYFYACSPSSLVEAIPAGLGLGLGISGVERGSLIADLELGRGGLARQKGLKL